MAKYERLSTPDRTFLDLEYPETHMHVGGVMVFDAKPLTTSVGGIGNRQTLHREAVGSITELESVQNGNPALDPPVVLGWGEAKTNWNGMEETLILGPLISALVWANARDASAPRVGSLHVPVLRSSVKAARN